MLNGLWDKITGGAEKRAKMNEVAATISIPSQPKVVQDISREFGKGFVDFGTISDLIKRDVALTAKIMKVANSPLFSRSTVIDSVETALMRLGAKQFKQTILASSLRQTIDSGGNVEEEFWAHSETIALICDHIARLLQPDLAEYSYMTGLFHDCGVPILIGRNPRYKALTSRALGRDRSVAQEEENLCEIDHGTLGYVMTRSWSLPVVIMHVIQVHHSDDFLMFDDPIATKLHVILAIAENYYATLHKVGDEIFTESNRNAALLIAMESASGWSASQIVSLSKPLDAEFKAFSVIS